MHFALRISGSTSDSFVADERMNLGAVPGPKDRNGSV